MDYSVIDYCLLGVWRHHRSVSFSRPQISCAVWRLSNFMQVIFHYLSAKSCGVSELGSTIPNFTQRTEKVSGLVTDRHQRLPDPLQQVLWDVWDGWLHAVTLTCCCQHNFAAVNLSRLSASRTRRLSREMLAARRELPNSTWRGRRRAKPWRKRGVTSNRRCLMGAEGLRDVSALFCL